MRLNADFTQRVVITPDHYQWVASPQKGVERMMLDRIGDEKARATSLVRYAPKSYFPRHEHPQGEEILVLAGTFSEEGHDFQAGCYLRNPHGTSHQPFTEEGALIFVKLRQMPAVAGPVLHTDTRDAQVWQRAGNAYMCLLYEDDTEQVQMLQLPAQASLFNTISRHKRVAELLLIEGTLTLDNQSLPAGSWLRLPATDTAALVAGSGGARLYVKQYVPNL